MCIRDRLHPAFSPFRDRNREWRRSVPRAALSRQEAERDSFPCSRVRTGCRRTPQDLQLPEASLIHQRLVSSQEDFKGKGDRRGEKVASSVVVHQSPKVLLYMQDLILSRFNIWISLIDHLRPISIFLIFEEGRTLTGRKGWELCRRSSISESPPLYARSYILTIQSLLLTILDQ